MKNKTVAGVLALFLGGFGIHKFYLGKLNGIIYLIFCFTLIPSIIALIEAIRYFAMSEEDFNRMYNGNDKKKTNLEELEKLHSLKEKGAISEEEYKEKKAEILNSKKDKPKEVKEIYGSKTFFGKLNTWVNNHKVLAVFLCIFFIFFISGAISSISNTKDKTEDNHIKIEQAQQEAKKREDFINSGTLAGNICKEETFWSIERCNGRAYFINNEGKAGAICKAHLDWSEDDCKSLAERKIWIGMNLDMLKYLRGTPDSANPSNYGSGNQWQWCWHDYNPSCFYGGDDGIITSYN